MPRPVLLLTCVLALATGIALVGAGLTVTVPDRGIKPLGLPPDISRADTALVRQFYAAVNVTLATGDPAPMSALLAADFVDRTLPPGVPQTRDGLARHVLALRATFPALQLVTMEVLDQGEWVLVRIRAEGAAEGMFLGVPLAGVSPSWEALELVRVADGRIRERWAAGGWPVVPHPLAEGTLARPAEAGIVRLARFTFAPGGEQPEAPDLGPLVLTVEAGILRAEVEGPAVLTRGVPAGTGVPPGGEVVLRPGDSLVVPPGTGHRFRNAEPTPAVVVAATILPWYSPGVPDGEAFLWPVAGTPDITVHLLAEGEFAGLPTGPAVIRLGRLTLSGHAGLEPHAATGPHLAFVETGTLDAVTAGGQPALRSAGTAVLTQFGAAARLRNVGDGPLVVLLVTIAPVESASRPAGVLQRRSPVTAKTANIPTTISTR